MRTLRSSAPRPLAHSLSRFSSAAAICAALFASTAHSQNTWTAGSATNLSWDTGTNWSTASKPTASDDVIFPSPIPNPGTLTNPAVITLTAGELANSLTFNESYTLTGGNLTLSSGNISVATNFTATVRSALTSVGGLNKLGSGTLTLTNLANAYGGPLNLFGGTVQFRAVNTTSSNLGAPGFNATYYNFSSNPGIGSNLFASNLILGSPYVASRIEQTVNVPQPGANGVYPTTPIAGFGVAGAGGVNDGAMWKGILNVTQAGTYQFSGTNDDNAVLYIDGVQIGTLGVTSAVANIGSAVTLAAGPHNIVYKFTQGTGGGYTTLRYNGPDTSASAVLVGSIANTVTNGSLVTELGPIAANATSTIDIGGDSTITATAPATALSIGSDVTLNVTSPTISNLAVNGNTVLNGGLVTLNNTTASVTFNGPISENVGTSLRINGGYLTTFNAGNTYSGVTTVSSGELDLNAATGSAIFGDLLIDAANTGGLVSNVKLLRSNQIANSSAVTLSNGGILDLGAFDETVGTLTLTGNGLIRGTGTISATNLDLQTGTITARLGGSAGVTKNSAGVLTLAGNNTYTGVTAVNFGTLNAVGANALGAGGPGNGTVVANGATLLLSGANVSGEAISVTGAGVTNEGAVRSVGNSTIASLTTTGASTIAVDAGQLFINGALNVSGGPLTKTGEGALTFTTPQATLPAVTLAGGALGFSGTQNFGAATIPAGRAFRFNSDPGAGVNITAPAGTSVIAGYAADQNLISRIAATSAGTLALAADSGVNLDFSSRAALSLGATGLRYYTGNLTPGAAGYRLGGGGGDLIVTSTQGGTNAMNIAGAGSVTLSNPQNFTGAVNIDGAGRLKISANEQLGNNANIVNLTNGGALQYDLTYGLTGTNGNIFGILGNPVGGASRVINVGTGGGRLTLSNFANGASILTMIGNDVLTGSGDLVKDGYGFLTLTGSNSFSGKLTIAGQGGTISLRSNAALPNVSRVVIGQTGVLQLDNVNGIGTRQIGSAYVANRVNDAAPIDLLGGQIVYRARNAGGNIAETFGTVTPVTGQSNIRIEVNGQGGELTLANLARTPAAGTLMFENSAGAYGSTGNNPRIFLTQINGAASATTALLGGWAIINNNGGNFQFAAYDAAAGVGVKPATMTAQGAASFTPAAATIYDFNAAGTVTLADSASNSLGLTALRFSNGAAQTLAFADGNDTLFISSGGILDSNNNFTRAIGSTAQRGKLTAGASGAAAGAKELFFHINQNTTTIESNIIDNNGAVTLVKDLGGIIQINSPGNTFSGGVNLFGGRINAVGGGSLGTGNILIRGAALELQGAGAVSASATITAREQSELYLNASVAFTGAGDQFYVESGSTLTGRSNAANQSLASLTRVSTITAPGQVVLEPGATVRSTTMTAGDVMQNLPAGLGTSADLFFNTSAQGSQNQFINIGAGTPWRGIGSSVAGGTGWYNGTIYANSDFYLQGLVRNGSNQVVQLGAAQGATGGAGSYSIVNAAGIPINAYISGQMAMNEDTPVTMPGDLTFVVQSGGYLQPNFTQSFGSGGTTAKVVVQAGGTLDPGNFVQVGAAANQPQGKPYPIPSPVDAQLTVEAGGRFLINDVSGIGSTAAGNWRMKTDSILQIGTQNVFLGSNANGLINDGQFVFEPGTIVRLQADNIYKLSQFVPADVAGAPLIIEAYDANRSLTDATNPMIVAAPGTPTIEVMDVPLGKGSVLTNDSNDRQINERRGRLLLNDGAVIAATTQTYLNIQESVVVGENATITIGSTDAFDGLTKLGGVQFNGPQSNQIPASATINMLDGTQLVLGATNTWPDARAINLPIAVTAFPAPGAAALQPGNGTSLLLNVANFVEVAGPLTGNGTVMANQGNALLGAGYGATSDFTFNGAFKSTNAQNPGLVKFGTSKMTLTGVSDSTGEAVAEQGTLEISGTGTTRFSLRALEGATVSIDNTAVALDNRTRNANANFWIPSGGTFRFKGNATTPVVETVPTFANSAGNFANAAQVTGYTRLIVTPGAAATTLAINTLENFQSAGIALQRSGTWVIDSPSVANAPGTYGTDGTYTPNATNVLKGLVTVADPRFASANNGVIFGIGAAGTLINPSGSALVPIRPDYLADINGDGFGDGFVTTDSGTLLTLATTTGANTVTVSAGNLSAVAVGQIIATSGNIPAGATITAIDNNVLTLSANATGTGTVSGGVANANSYLRILAPSEYSSTMRDNQSTMLNVKLTGTTTTSGDTRIGTLTMTPGSVVNINGTLPYNSSASRLHLNAAGVYVQAGGLSTINGTANTFLQANGGASLYLHTQGDLDLNATAFTDNAIVKTGPGTLNVGSGAFTIFRGSLQIDGGTVNLLGNNVFANIRGTSGFTTNQNLFLNSGTLNLNGNSQFINRLDNNNPLPGMGGTLATNAPATITINGGGQFSGQVTGPISIDKTTNNTLLLTNDNPYTGSTTVRSGTIQLRDSGALSKTSALDIQYATLTLDNAYLSNVANRVPAGAPVTMKGGTINLVGAAGQVATQSLDNVTLVAGLNTFASNAGGSGANELTIGSLTRANGSGAVANFGQNYGFLGTAGNNTTAIRDFITNLNGSAVSLTNKILPTWMIANGDHFATYNTATGLSYLSNTGDGYANYDSTDATAAAATANVNDGTARTFTASKTINAWRIAPNAAVTMTFNQGVAFTLGAGGLITNNNNTASFNAAVGSTGQSLTSGTAELNAWINQNTTGINIPIVGGIDFIKSGGGALNLNPASTYSTGVTVTSGSATVAVTNTTGLAVGQLVSGTGIPAGTTITAITPNTNVTLSNNATAAGTSFAVNIGNSYTGNTFVTGGTLTLNLAAANGGTVVSVPGDLVINNATVTEANVPGQLKTTAKITVTGGGRFNAVALPGVTETIGSIVVTDVAGANGTTNIIDRTSVQPTSTVLLSAANAITTTNTNPATVPFVGGFTGNIGFTNAAGATLNLNAPAPLSGLAAVALRVDANIATVPTGIAEGGLIKTGTGILALNPNFGVAFTTANGSNAVTAGSTTGMYVGMPVFGTGIPAGTTVASITSGTAFTLSANATTSATNTLTFIPAPSSNFNNATGYDGTLASLKDVLNVSSGFVRADAYSSLGTNAANTTVQNGAVLLLNVPAGNNGNFGLTGSIKLKDGSTMAATINGTTIGIPTTTVANQSVLNVAGGTVNITAYDYFVPGTNNGNITINGRLTGNGSIVINGPAITQGAGGGGVISLQNPIRTGPGSNDYSGTITIGTNAILQSLVAIVAPDTRNSGSALGTATINLNGGRLRIRDDGSASGDISNSIVDYGNNVVLLADSYLDANRQTSTTATGNIINLGSLTVAAGTRTLNVDSGNSYQVSFTQLNGPGTLVKGGNGIITLNAIATGANTPSLGIAGPVGRVLSGAFNTTTSSNINFVPDVVGLKDLSINGFYSTPASKTLNVSGTLSVNPNVENTSGALGVNGFSVVNAGSVVNNGQIGSVVTAGAITSTGGFSGTGLYIARDQQLDLNGNFTSGTLKVAGENIVKLAGSVNAPIEVQSGTLQLVPPSSLTTAGTLKVYGSPATPATLTSAPVAQFGGTLEFNAGPSTVTHNGDITNNGTVRLTSGSMTVNGVIAGTTTQYLPGLLEGYTTAAGGTMQVDDGRVPNPGNFGIRLEPRMLQTNAVTQQAITGHTDNDTWIYTGYLKDDDGIFSFAENIDDRAAVWVDGQLVLNAANGGTSRVVSTAFKDGQQGTLISPNANAGTPLQNFGPGVTLPGRGDGWHLIEIRMNNGAGGSGPIAGNGFGVNYGFGYKNGIAALDGSDMIKPFDDGTGNLFVTPIGGSGQIDVASGSTLKARGFQLTSNLIVGGEGAVMELTAPGANQTDAISAFGGTNAASNQLKIPAGASVAAGALTVSNSGVLKIAGSPGSALSVGTTTLDGTLNIEGSDAVFTGASTGFGGIVNVNSGRTDVAVGGSLKGTVNLNNGTLAIAGNGALATSAFVDGSLNVLNGSGVIDGVVVGDVALSGGILSGTGSVLGRLTASGGNLAPGSPIFGTLSSGNFSLQSAAKLSIQLGGGPASALRDQLAVAGSVSLAGKLDIRLEAFIPQVNDIFYLILNDGTDAVSGTFQGLPNNSLVSFNNVQWRIRYDLNGDAGALGNDVALIAQTPEPGTAAALLVSSMSLLGMRRFRRSKK